MHAGQEATVRTLYGKTDWSKIEKGVQQGCILSPSYLTYVQCTSGEMLGWMKPKMKSRLPGESISYLKYADDTTLKAESEEELKSLLMKVKEKVTKLA